MGQTTFNSYFFILRARPSAGDNRNEHWSLSHSPVEHIISSPVSIHGNHPFAPVSDYDMNQPLALTKSTSDFGVSRIARSVVSSTVERQQVCSLVIIITQAEMWGFCSCFKSIKTVHLYVSAWKDTYCVNGKAEFFSLHSTKAKTILKRTVPLFIIDIHKLFVNQTKLVCHYILDTLALFQMTRLVVLKRGKGENEFIL